MPVPAQTHLHCAHFTLDRVGALQLPPSSQGLHQLALTGGPDVWALSPGRGAHQAGRSKKFRLKEKGSG